MTEETVPVEVADSASLREQDHVEVIERPRPRADYVLHDIVELAGLGVEIGLTLYVGGSVISGRVVSGKRYFEELIKGVSESAPEILKEPLAARFGYYLPIYEKFNDERLAGKEVPPPEFIHLMDARCWTPGGGSTPLVWWRGRIARVDGFSVGTFDS